MEKSGEELLERAKVKEKEYNWIEAVNLYETAVKSFLDKNMIKRAAETYKNLGYAYEEAAHTVETAEKFIEFRNHAANAFTEAMNLFKKIQDKPEELECEALALYIKGTITKSAIESKKILRNSYELIMKANQLYSRKIDQVSIVRTLCYAASILWCLCQCCSDLNEYYKYNQKCAELAKKSWKLSKKTKNFQFLAEALEAEYNSVFLGDYFLTNIRKNESSERKIRACFSRCEESLIYLRDSSDYRALGRVYFTAGQISWQVGFHFIKDENEQQEYFNKALELLERAVIFSKKSKHKHIIINSLVYLNHVALNSRKIEFLQKRIFNDITEVINLGSIYTRGGYCTYNYGFSNLLPAEYYSSLAQMSFFTPAQRTFCAAKGIEYAKNLLFVWSSFNPSVPYLTWPLWFLTFSYSTLTTFTPEKSKSDGYAQKMLQYADQTNKISEKFEGGLSKSAGYMCQYRAYKTLAEITENREERIKMLSIAANAQKKYIPHSLESRTGIITAQIRLGLLYEEIGIISGENNPLLKAKENFLEIIKKSLDRGYIIYAAIAHEYLARVEDRLGDHTVSAENYLKAHEMHKESLKNIEYKRLKKRINEKVEYTLAWCKIERAKAHHKSENHLKAKKFYEEASETLKKVSRYNFEGYYYGAWSLLEQAEQFSKEEKQKDAINQYELTINTFEEAIKILQGALRKAKQQPEKERIEKLEKVAKVRINYCTARINLEQARLLGKNGDHSTAAEKFAIAAVLFRNVCTKFKLERERKELEAIYYLCRAWENMELAEKFEEPDRFAEAAGLFTKASNFFTDIKLKLLSEGNSAFCQALEYGCKFDETIDIKVKTQLYPKVKLMLSKAASSYEKGNLKSGADWALATSIYFDATWHLIRADQELDLTEKRKLLGIGSEYLKSAGKLFNKAGYKNKEREIQDRLNRVDKEERILVSALNTITQPSISRSTAGIIAPTCPIEISQSPRLGEVRQFTEEEIRVAMESKQRKKYELVYRDLIKEYPRIEKRECRIAIAQIGLSKTGNIIGEFYEMKATGLINLREDKIESVRANVKKLIEQANESRVNLLLFPEMTIDFNYSEFLEEISTLAKLYEMYIIPGSYHDQESKQNLSMVIGPDGILWKQEKHIPAIIHLGKKRFKEAIEVGSFPRKTIVCNTEYGRIAIAICRDFLDMDLRVELKNFEPPVDIILNPAFTPVTADFKAAHFDARRSIYAYCFFANVAEFGDSLIYTPEKERIERTLPAKEAGLIYKDVDIFKLRSERKKWEKEQKKEKPFIQSTR